MASARLLLEPWRTEGDRLIVAASLEAPRADRQRLWWSLPASLSGAVTPWADPFVVGFLFSMMQAGRDVHVEGRVSPSLLRNLEAFMAVWSRWEPGRYRPLSIGAAEEAEPPPPEEPGLALVPFSCGADSCFTVLRHQRGLVGRRSRRIGAGVVMHGFDIWLDERNAAAMYEGLLASAGALLGSLGIDCIPLASNFHELPTVWAHSHGAHLVAGLRLLGARFDTALIANSVPYDDLDEHWGSHPLCDPLLGSRAMAVVDDGAECGRVEKARLLAQWPEAMRHLRVCFENPGSHTNCCRCQKCIQTILSFRAAGCGLPPAFPQDVTDRRVRRERFHERFDFMLWEQIIAAAREGGLGRTSWCKAMLAALRRNRRRRNWKRFQKRFLPLRGAIRVLFRGSALPRRVRAKPPVQAIQAPISRS